MAFEVIQKDDASRARCGRLTTKHGVIETPHYLLPSLMGSPNNLTPDLLRAFNNVDGLQMALQDVVLDLESIQGLDKGVHGFIDTERPLLFTIRDPSEFIEYSVSEETCTVASKSGRYKVSPKDLVHAEQILRPDLMECISVEAPHYIVSKRVRKSVDITLKWLDECLRLEKEHGLVADGETSKLMAVIQGGTDLKCRKFSAQLSQQRNVAGFVLGSLGLGENSDQRRDVIKTVVDELPESKPRMIGGIGGPDEVLECISQGIDLFSSNYIDVVTEWGYALTFPITSSQSDGPYKINLQSKTVMRDATPILPDCQCYTCGRHTKAYLHHLFNTHEMLVSILLTIHNTWHYMKFFSVIREQMRDGTFEKWKQEFLQRISQT
eukprot:TRINITY_DN5485_c1_g1_i1.p1 TRINITY_DN5485_c1_g1~~TRINITY_DN5485_c1_g1_i1.p1  ORF type:complete len:380 (+),score=80.64 TRINITY_DN5485_c1_g1_i1:215-1354(+)